MMVAACNEDFLGHAFPRQNHARAGPGGNPFQYDK